MRLFGLLAAVALSQSAAAGWVQLSYSPTPGATALRSGCVAAGQYERPAVTVAAAAAGSVTIAGLPDVGRCYFTLDAGPQDEWFFDFGTLSGGPSLPGPIQNVAITWSPTPAGRQFLSSDVGAVGLAGSYSVAISTVGAVTYTLKGAGADIWTTASAFRFAYVQLTGDFDLRARVVSLTAADGWAKAGAMVSDTLDPSSAYAFSLVTPVAANGADFQDRPSAGAAAVVSNASDHVNTAPYCVRVSRVGNTFTGYGSKDCVTWTLKRSAIIPMGATVNAGLAVTSHNVAALATAVFDSVTITP